MNIGIAIIVKAKIIEVPMLIKLNKVLLGTSSSASIEVEFVANPSTSI